MPYTIFDCDQDTSAKLAEIKTAGYTAVMRYDDRFPSGNWKQVHLPEVHNIRNAGLQLAIVYEDAGATLSTFTEQNGYLAAKYARQQAALRGQPDGSAEYFAVDFDPTISQISNQIVAYFRGVQQAFAEASNLPVLVAGVYGSGLVCKTLLSLGLIKYRMITCSRGFNGSREAIANGEYELLQDACDKKLLGLDVDFDIARVENWGQFVPWGPPVVPPVIPAPPPIAHDIRWLQGLLIAQGLYHGNADGDVGPLTVAAMISYVEKHEPVVEAGSAPT